MTISATLSIRARTPANDYELGVIQYGEDRVVIELESGKTISSDSSGDFIFEVRERVSLSMEGRTVVEPIESNTEILLKPILVIRHPYTRFGGQFIEDIFPPSTSGFYGRLLNGEEEAVYYIQKVMNRPQFWLVITDTTGTKVFETHLVQAYEAEALALVDDYRIKQKPPKESRDEREDIRNSALSILDGPPPSWEELSELVEDVSIPKLDIGSTMRDTLTQVVPTSFPEAVREELMAFLAFVVQNKIPDEEPVSYLSRFSSTPILRLLVSGHLMHLIDHTNWPPYVKLMIQAARGQIDAPKRAVTDATLSYPWFIFIQKCAEILPNWLAIAVDSVRKLNESNRVILGLPTTSSAAKRSKASWKKRFAELSYWSLARGYVDASSLGLVEFVYLGAAYRWPHRHMKFITRLGAGGENSPHLQVMIVPHSAAERLRRALPSVLSVEWSARTLNLDLFDSSSSTWAIPHQKIVDSLERRSTVRKLTNQFGGKKPRDVYVMSKDDAVVADRFSEGLFLSDFETPEFLKNIRLEKKQIRKLLKNLIQRKVINLKYEISDPTLITLATVLQGRSETVTSIVSELLSSTPTSFARIDKTGRSGVVLSRLPEESVHIIAPQLTSQGIDYDVNIRCMRPTAFRGYTSNLYQRLLQEDGTWDDDVSAFLSQARSKRRELSESNA